ncbi:unnamed protein product [Mytilus edulis]|uniref:DDE-1 domain-containing protein n=1 Tax=Mytilus edulis TaxID=6550 RepID=A0A8S3QMQ3_MYTED|nr:unnamed protein product [Mytilus edulis]
MIIHTKLHGEKKDSDVKATKNYLEHILSNLLEQFNPNDVYNADETGLYYRALPENTLTRKDDNVAGGKKLKDRITTMVFCNMTSTDKHQLLIIGKSEDTRCFRGKKSLPVIYKNNKNSWMTSEIFKEWLKDLNKDMRQDKDIENPPNMTEDEFIEYVDHNNNTECYGELTNADTATSILQDKPMRNSDPVEDSNSKDELEESIIPVNFSQANTSGWFTPCYGGTPMY